MGGGSNVTVDGLYYLPAGNYMVWTSTYETGEQNDIGATCELYLNGGPDAGGSIVGLFDDTFVYSGRDNSYGRVTGNAVVTLTKSGYNTVTTQCGTETSSGVHFVGKMWAMPITNLVAD